MKRLIAILSVCMLCFAGCSTQDAQESTAETTVPVYKALPLPDLYVEVPEHFETTSSEFYEEYYICEDASIIMTQDMKGAPYSSVYDYATSALAEYQKVTSELELLNMEQVQAGNAAVQLMEFTYTIGDEEASISKTCMVGYLTDTRSMYIITCKSDLETYDTYRDDFLTVITSAAFVK